MHNNKILILIWYANKQTKAQVKDNEEFLHHGISPYRSNQKSSTYLGQKGGKLGLLNVFGVGVSCRYLYHLIVYLYVNCIGSITG